MPLSRRIAVLAGAVLLVSASTTQVVADGVVIPPTATAKVTIPDQEAIIHYKDGVETLAIETRFVGQGQQFAWIVPLPSVPEVSPVSKGTFPTLRILFRPRVIHTIPRFYIGVILLFLLIALIMLRRLDLLLLYVLSLFFCSCLLPSLGTAGVGVAGVSGTSVRIHDRQMVGDYEIFTISSDEPDALLNWLGQNGFVVGERQQSVIADYVAQGWKFVAVKLLRPSDTNAPTTPHPLAFTFRTDRPVYPLKLTATSGSPCSIDLYVFGPARAAVPGFKVTECTQVSSDSSHRPARDARIPLEHPGLRTLVGGSDCATKLSATLSPDQMRQDAFVSWQPFQETEQVFYSRRGVCEILINIAVLLFGVSCLVVLRAITTKRMSSNRAKQTLVLVGTGILTMAAGVYAVWPTQEVRVSQAPRLWNQIAHGMVARWLEEVPFDQPVTIDAVQARIAHYMHSTPPPWRGRQDYAFAENPFTGRPRILEDSPGNYELRWNKERVLEYVWYEEHGGEEVIPLEELSAVMTTQPASSPSEDQKQESTQ